MRHTLAALPEPDPREARPPDTAVPRFWKPSGLAPHLSMTRQSVYNLIHRGELEAIRINGSLRIPEPSILAYLARCRRGE